jgi:PAS domain S-box-containing protein
MNGEVSNPAESGAGMSSNRARGSTEPKQSENPFRRLFEATPTPYQSLDHEGRILDVNATWLDGLGYSAEEVIGRSFADFQSESSAAAFPQRFAAYLAAGEIHGVEIELVRKDGSILLASFEGRIATDDDGRFARTHCVFIDVTDRRRSERALAQAERRFRETIENVDLIGVALDAAGRTTFANDHLLRLTGWTREEVIGREWFDTFLPESNADEVRQVFARTLKRGDIPAHFDNPILTRDGEERLVHWSNTVIKDADGHVIGTFSLGEDRTEVAAAEETLRQSEARYRSLFTAMAEGFALHKILCDDAGVPNDYRFLDANPAFFDLTGLPRDIIGRTVREVMPETEDFWVEAYGRVATTGEPIEIERYSAALGRHFEVRAFSPHSGQFATLFLDVSTRRRAEVERLGLLREVHGLAARLAAAEDAERKELANELHDRVGQSLTALGLNLSALRGRLSTESQSELGLRLDDAEELLRSTAGEVRDVMAELRPPMLDPYGLVAALRWLGERFSDRAGIEVTVSGDEPSPRLGPAVEMTLFRIVQEALTNIAKHASASTVAIAVTPAAEGTILAVTDDGRGFDPKAARASAGGKRSWGQLIMQERAVAVGATCTVISRPGHGTTVRLEISRQPEDEIE